MGLTSSIFFDKRFKAADTVVSSKSLVELLRKKLENKKVNKNLSQSHIPSWILQNREHRVSYLRSLMDMDGGIYYIDVRLMENGINIQDYLFVVLLNH